MHTYREAIWILTKLMIKIEPRIRGNDMKHKKQGVLEKISANVVVQKRLKLELPNVWSARDQCEKIFFSEFLITLCDCTNLQQLVWRYEIKRGAKQKLRREACFGM